MNKLQTENVPQLSRLFVQAESNVSDQQGAYTSTALSRVISKGVCLESTYPYDITDDVRNLKFPPRTSDIYNEAKQYKLIKSSDTTTNVDTMKKHIKKYGCCMMTNRYLTYESYYKNVMYYSAGKDSGLHETMIVGYDDDFEMTIKGKTFKGAFLRVNTDTPEIMYEYGLQIIPYEFFDKSKYNFFVKAHLPFPSFTSDYLEKKYTGVGITIPTDTIEMVVGDNNVLLNGEAKTLSAKPVIVNGTTLVPLRCVDLFRKCDVVWDNNTKTATIQHQLGELKFKIGRKEVLDGYGKVVATALEAPQLINGSTMIPIRVLAEALGCEVKWDSKEKKITIIR